MEVRIEFWPNNRCFVSINIIEGHMSMVYDGICLAAVTLYKRQLVTKKMTVADVRADHPVTREEMEEVH